MTEKNENSTSVTEPDKKSLRVSTSGPVYVTVMDILRFILAWAVITFLWMMLNVCPDCGHHHVGHGNLAPIFAGGFGAIFFHVLRLIGRKSSGSVRKDADQKS